MVKQSHPWPGYSGNIPDIPDIPVLPYSGNIPEYSGGEYGIAPAQCSGTQLQWNYFALLQSQLELRWSGRREQGGKPPV